LSLLDENDEAAGIAMDTKTVAKAIVLNPQRQILLLKRSKTDSRRPGDWDFPGGEVEKGEEMNVGVVREIREETGLIVRPGDVVLVYAATEAYADLSVTRLLFVARTTSAEVTLSREHDSFRWVDFETALRDFPHPFYATALRYAIEHQLVP
jgi:8-oxo-dGTP diphosphatase